MTFSVGNKVLTAESNAVTILSLTFLSIFLPIKCNIISEKIHPENFRPSSTIMLTNAQLL